ncbi:hypothetical protein BOO86_27635 [Mycobacterium sp. CBMA 234]|uniref:DUF5336 domain-containing protein n=1 Tax=Mycolicibacterium sp. CBMA 234 TaxID=1918495 RepID=UPI0012DC7C44|nr:DUF5336 domain-containing protein [Mycolicibacterium sp. CBMA 234]MUL68272.1 hypothetical protein [Mycolicibacterium sp. CBMA 234]
MTYQPGNPGYPPAPQPNQFGGPTQQFGRLPEQIPPTPTAPPAPAGPSKLPEYLTSAVAALGLLIFGFNFAPQLGAGGLDTGTGSILTQAPIVVAVLAALLAGVTLLPKQKSFKAWVAILAVLALLLVINEVIQAPQGVDIEWGLYVVLALSVLQAGSAVAALLLESGIIQPPAPRPQQPDPYNYGAPGQGYNPQGQYYGQQQGQQQPQQRPEYGQQTGQHFGQQGGYQSQPQGPIGGYTGPQSQQHSPDSGPPTPPTGFPAFGQPQSQANQGPSVSEAVAGSSSYAPPQSAPGVSGSASEPTTTFPQPQAPQQSGPTSS